mgnify:FL=1
MNKHPIKFRAFANGKMRKVRAISFTETGEVHRILDGEEVQRVPEALLQFTGLRDTNGTEVYAGYVIRLYDTNRYCICGDWEDCNGESDGDHRIHGNTSMNTRTIARFSSALRK